MSRFAFPKQARLRQAREFGHVYRGGLRLTAVPLRVAALRRKTGRSRLGLAVGRKVGGAVVRNRWKRAIREAFRLNRHRLCAPYDLVISVDWGTDPARVRHVAERFRMIVDELNKAETGREAQRGDP